MRKIIFLFFLVVVMACQSKKQPTSEKQEVPEIVEHTKLANDTIWTVDALTKTSDSLLNREVRVEGLVTHVCKHSGKRLHLTGNSEDVKIRVEAMGNIDQFERALEGSTIIVKGILRQSEGMPEESEHQKGDPTALASTSYFQQYFIEGISFAELNESM